MNHNMGNMTFLAPRKRVLCKKLLKNRNLMACISCGNIKKRVQRKWLYLENAGLVIFLVVL